jgi:glutamine amidotransferase
MITIINTKAGNFGSVINAFKYVGAQITIGSTPEEIQKATALILPGVSAFASGINNLKEANLISVIKEKVQKQNTPIIGICLGMQLLAETSNEHGNHEGLGLIKGAVTKLVSNETEYRVPNIGWYNVTAQKESVLFSNTPTQSFYHVHSYYMQCADKQDVAATIKYSGQDVTVAIERNNIFGVQFHPEKSQDAGLDLLQRFVKYAS